MMCTEVWSINGQFAKALDLRKYIYTLKDSATDVRACYLEVSQWALRLGVCVEVHGLIRLPYMTENE